MTREELIEMLNILLDNAEIGCADITVIKHVSFDSFKFVLVQTIKALEQEPTDDATLKDIFCMGCEYKEQEPCGDAISRSDMLDAIGHGTTYTSEDLQRIIKGLPSVNPQPCGDAISRQAVLKELKESAEHHANDSREEVLLRRDRDIVRALPSVNPQPICEEREKGECPYYAG